MYNNVVQLANSRPSALCLTLKLSSFTLLMVILELAAHIFLHCGACTYNITVMNRLSKTTFAFASCVYWKCVASTERSLKIYLSTTVKRPTFFILLFLLFCSPLGLFNSFGLI